MRRWICMGLLCCRSGAPIQRDPPLPENTCSEAAKACDAALVANDVDGMFACMADEELAAQGGRDKARAVLDTRRHVMRDFGDLELERVDEERPTVVAGGKLVFAIVQRAGYL